MIFLKHIVYKISSYTAAPRTKLTQNWHERSHKWSTVNCGLMDVLQTKQTRRGNASTDEASWQCYSYLLHPLMQQDSNELAGVWKYIPVSAWPILHTSHWSGPSVLCCWEPLQCCQECPPQAHQVALHPQSAAMCVWCWRQISACWSRTHPVTWLWHETLPHSPAHWTVKYLSFHLQLCNHYKWLKHMLFIYLFIEGL